MPPRRRRLAITLGAISALAIAGALAAAPPTNDLVRIATGAVSHSLCAAAFISGLDPEQVFREEQLPEPGMRTIAWALRRAIDRERREARVSVLGQFGARAVYRPGLGCLLVRSAAPVPEPAGLPLPSSAAAPAPIVAAGSVALTRAIDTAFAEPDAQAPRRTKAVVVMHDGALIAERYAPGYSPSTPIWGHSLTKSVTNALVGILVRQGKLQV